VLHTGNIPARGKPRTQVALDVFDLLTPLAGSKQVQAGPRHRTGQSIGHKGWPVHEHPAVTADAFGHLTAAHGGGQSKHSAGKGLAAAKNVWADAGPLSCEHLARAPETCGNFIKDKQGISIATQLRQPAQIVWMIKPHAPCPLHHRLKNDRSDFFPVLLQHLTGMIQTGRIKRLIKTARRLLHKKLARQHAREQAVHAGNRVAYGHGPDSVAVVAATRGQKAGALRLSSGVLVLQRHLEGDINRHGAGIGKKDAFKAVRHKAQQLFSQSHGRFMRKPAEHDMGHAPGLTMQSLQQMRVVIAVYCRPP